VREAVNSPQPAVASEPTGGAAPLIPEEWRPLVEELLTSGLAVEDIVEAVVDQGGPHIREGAILAHFRTHAHLQKHRVENTVDGAAKLRAALGNPEADHGLTQLANSALMIGYMGLTKKRSNSITIKDAEVIRLARQNLKLRQRYLRLKEVNVKRANELQWRKLRYEDVKYETAVTKLRSLRHALRALMNEGKLEPDTLDKIREIYGIIKQPYIAEDTEEPPDQGQ
jgi:hypothetical protein